MSFISRENIQYYQSTFTPTVTLVGGAGNTTPVYSTNTGRYIRIQNLCIMTVYLTGDGGAEGAGTGVINIALPFTASASQPTGIVVCGQSINGADIRVLGAQIAASATTAALSRLNLGDLIDLTGADQNNVTRTIRFTIAYEV